MMDLALLAKIDRQAAEAGTTRSELIRQALRERFAEGGRADRPARREKIAVAGRKFTFTIERDRHWWIASVEELPGCGTQGRTLKELRAMVADAIEGYLIVRGDIPDHAASASAV
jgi:predicted RNase H-like HicB family nuclease